MPKADPKAALRRGTDSIRVPLGTIGKGLAATAAIAAVGGGALVVSGYTPWVSAKTGDLVTQQEATARESAFATQLPLGLSLVSQDDVGPAVDQMGLASNEKEALLANLRASPSHDTGTAAPTPRRESATQPVSRDSARLRLAWLTLWDTDAEDGDAVRIDSGAFSRTVTLSKQPITIAIPVPPDFVVRVAGIRDGEGGGITVGLASGGARAIFPIMSVGQTLGLRVQVN